MALLFYFYRTGNEGVLARTCVPLIKSRELRDLIASVMEAGWRVNFRGGHVTVYPPDEKRSPIVISSSPSDSHAVKNCRSQLRRAGLNLG